MFQSLTIVGLGLMGASLARDVRKRKLAKHILGVDKSKQHRDFVLQKKWVHEVSTKTAEALKKSDVVILAMPVVAIEAFLEKWGASIPATTLVMDVGSTKKQILEIADQHLPQGNFVGCHPMAGTENPGPFLAKENLFATFPCFLVAGKNTKKAFVKQAKAFWEGVGAKVAYEEADEHDQVMALISHLPQLMASLLSVSVLDEARLDVPSDVKKSCRKFLGEGFKDMIRIASSPHEMWRDIFLKNSNHVLREIQNFKQELSKIENALKTKDEKQLESFMKLGARLRKGI